MYDIGQCFKSETLNTLLGFFVTVVCYLIYVHAMLAIKILGIWIKISELSLAVISFLLTFLYLYLAYHKIVIFDTIKNHYLSQFKDAQSKMQQYRKMETESWYTMTLRNISDIFCPWNICRLFPPYNRYMYVICHFY